MLINGWSVRDALNDALYPLWYRKQYQYYFAGPNHYPIRFSDEKGDENGRVFASVGKDKKLHGCMGYTIDPAIRGAWSFYAIRFPDGDKLVFGRDLLRCVDDVFIKFGLNRLGFGCVADNPAKRMYDKYIELMGGRIAGHQHEAAVDQEGRLCDFTQYEILRRNYVRSGMYKRQRRTHTEEDA